MSNQCELNITISRFKAYMNGFCAIKRLFLHKKMPSHHVEVVPVRRALSLTLQLQQKRNSTHSLVHASLYKLSRYDNTYRD